MDDPLAHGLRVTVEDGTVLVDGAGVALALTAEAAKDLGEQLYAAVIVALAHRAAGPPPPKLGRIIPTNGGKGSMFNIDPCGCICVSPRKRVGISEPLAGQPRLRTSPTKFVGFAITSI